jgi:uncharacterized oligopeptide transporter (OPT) family protein
VTRDFSTLPDDTPPKPPLLQRAKALPTGTKVVCGSGILLFFSLFLTWQNREVSYGRTGTDTAMLDGWDTWGVVIGFATVGLITLVLLVNASDVDMSPDIRWDVIALGGAVAILLLTLLKNLTDADSAWASYLGVLLAAGLVVGAYLDWADERPRRSLRRPRRRRLRSAA